MKTFMILAALSCAAVLAGCSTPPTAIDPADVAQAISNGCLVVQPTLTATAGIVPNPELGLATVVNGVFCTANETAAAAAVAGAAKAATPVPASAPVAASQ